MIQQHAGAIDARLLRNDFPVLSKTMRGKPVVYLDNGATSLKPISVIEAELAYYRDLSANIHRGVYELSQQATALYDEAREAVRRFVNARAVEELIFTRGTTEGVNLVARSWGEKFLKPGDEIVLTDIEHHSNLVPWQALAQRTGAVLRFIEYLPAEHRLKTEDLDRLIGSRTRLVAVTGMSNVTGYVPPLGPIVEAAHAVGAVVLVDGAQLVSHHPVDVRSIDCDFLVFSGHKMCGPTGIGVLYARRAVLETMDPFHYGGDMIVRVSKERSTFKPLPDRFEAGTPNIAGALGLRSAIEYLESVGLDVVAIHEEELLAYSLDRAVKAGFLEVYGGPDATGRGGIFSFNLLGKDGEPIHAHDVGSILDTEGVAIRAGFHCAQPFMKILGAAGTVRASFYLYNDRSDVDALFSGLERAREVFS